MYGQNGQNGGQGVPPQNYYYQRPPVQRRNGMASLALLMAVLSVLTIITGVGPLFFGPLAIIFAVLSKGGQSRMQGAALLSSVVGGAGALLGLALTTWVVISFTTDPNMKDNLNKSFEAVYGVDYDEFQEGMQHYYETGEMPDFMNDYYNGGNPFMPGGSGL